MVFSKQFFLAVALSGGIASFGGQAKFATSHQAITRAAPIPLSAPVARDVTTVIQDVESQINTTTLWRSTLLPENPMAAG